MLHHAGLPWTEELAQWLGVHTTLPEGRAWFPVPCHVTADLTSSSALSRCLHRCAQLHLHVHFKKIFFLKKKDSCSTNVMSSHCSMLDRK